MAADGDVPHHPKLAFQSTAPESSSDPAGAGGAAHTGHSVHASMSVVSASAVGLTVPDAHDAHTASSSTTKHPAASDIKHSAAAANGSGGGGGGAYDPDYHHKHSLLVRYFEYNTKCELDELLAITHPDMIAHYNSSVWPVVGKPAFKAQIERIFKQTKQCLAYNRVYPHRIVIDGDRAIVHWGFEYRVCCCGCECCGVSELSGYNDFEFKRASSSSDGQWLLSMVRTTASQQKPWYLSCYQSCARSCCTPPPPSPSPAPANAASPAMQRT